MLKLNYVVCSHCEWIFKIAAESEVCPKCENPGHYKARPIYGNSTYNHSISQKKWLEKQMFSEQMRLKAEIAGGVTRDGSGNAHFSLPKNQADVLIEIMESAAEYSQSIPAAGRDEKEKEKFDLCYSLIEKLKFGRYCETGRKKKA